MKFKKAFTLSEAAVAIAVTSTIIAMAIPATMQNTYNKNSVLHLKNIYTRSTKAFEEISTEQKTLNAISFDNFAKKLKPVKNCGYSKTECWYSSPIKGLDGKLVDWANDNKWNRGELTDGTLIAFKKWTKNDGAFGSEIFDKDYSKSIIGTLMVDISGKDSPNVMGRDVFGFWVTKNGIMPWGAIDITPCQEGSVGNGCASKILSENAVNY